MHDYAAERQVTVSVARVDQVAELVGTQFLASIAEHEKHRVDHVRLSATVRPDDRCEALVEGSQQLAAGIGFEVDVLDVGDHQSIAGLVTGIVRRLWSWRNENAIQVAVFVFGQVLVR